MKRNNNKPFTRAFLEQPQWMSGSCGKLEFQTILCSGAKCASDGSTCKNKTVRMNKKGRRRYYLLEAEKVELLHACILPKLRRLTL